MKKHLFITIILLLPILIFSQDLDRLDKVNGFRKFKLGSSLNSFSNLKTLNTAVKLRGVTEYIYTGSDITDFYGVPIKEIKLAFFKNRLYKIGVSFGTTAKEYTYEYFDLIQTNFEVNFGKDFQKIPPSTQPGLLNCHIWDAKTVRLESVRANFTSDNSKNSQDSFAYGYILFIHKNLQKEQQYSEIED